jgi:hypothetical protein
MIRPDLVRPKGMVLLDEDSMADGADPEIKTPREK